MHSHVPRGSQRPEKPPSFNVFPMNTEDEQPTDYDPEEWLASQRRRARKSRKSRSRKLRKRKSRRFRRKSSRSRRRSRRSLRKSRVNRR
jgi:hypothetical protein